MRVAVTGAAGRLGRVVVPLLRERHDVVALARADLDITDRGAVERVLTHAEPEVVLGLAAMTDVDANQRDPDAARGANADAPGHLATVATAIGARLIHLSTSFVFDGRSDRPYLESDRPAPISVYGRVKLEGERRVLAADPRHVVVRTDALFGDGPEHASRALAAMRAGDEAAALVDRICSPTFVPDLAAALIDIIASAAGGVVHLAGPEPTSWFALIDRARAVAGLPGALRPQSIHDLHLDAPRPTNSSLASERLAALGIPPLPPLDDVIRRWTVAR